MTVFIEDRSVLARTTRAPDDVLQYGNLPEHRADVFIGTAHSHTRPLVVMIHGGFWRPAFDRMHLRPTCAAIAAAGWTVASIEYRRIPGQPDATIEDVCNAVASLPALVKQHNGKAIVMGHSAGGHLCLYVASISSFPRRRESISENPKEWVPAYAGMTEPSALIGAIALAPAADLQMAHQLKLGDGAAQAFLGVPAVERKDLDPAQLPSATIAITIVHGLQDATVPIAVAESYLSKHPATHLVKVDQCGHFAVIDPLADAWPTIINELNRLSAS